MDLPLTVWVIPPVGMNVPGSCNEGVDDDVHRHDVHSELVITYDAADGASADLHHDTCDAADVVHPARHWLPPRCCYCHRVKISKYQNVIINMIRSV
jgi:hypothetical protein